MSRRTKRYWAKRRRRVKLRLERAANGGERLRDMHARQYRAMCGSYRWHWPGMNLGQVMAKIWPQGDLMRHFYEQRQLLGLIRGGPERMPMEAHL